MALPILDPKPKGVPHDWSYNKIQEIKGVEPTYPESYKNPLYVYLAKRDQSARGTCVGMSSAYLWDLNYMKLTHDLPTDADKAQYRTNVADPNGVTVYDILYPDSSSAECFYQISRNIGNITYPSGSEIRFAARAIVEFGACLESDWRTDKSARGVYLAPPDPDKVNKFANDHRAEGYAVIYGMDAIKQAIYEKGFVLGAIPIYANYTEMMGGDGTFPDPKGEIVGYHALCFYGYDSVYLYFLHSWGNSCGMFGKLSRIYYQTGTMDDQHFMVILDSKETVIGHSLFSGLEIISSPQAKIYVNSQYSGDTPITISIEKGKDYIVEAVADGFYPKTIKVNDSMKTLAITLDEMPKGKVENLSQILRELVSIFRRLLCK
jgi:hypothetical protein